MNLPAGTFIRFEPLTPNPATLRWAVMNRESHHQVGTVSWHGPWRKYCFFPGPGMVFEEVCLQEIAAFLTAATTQHRQNKNQKP